MDWYFTHIIAFIHSSSFTTWVLWLRLYFIGEEMEALWVGDFPGSHELEKSHQNLVWSRPVTIPAGPPCSAQCCWLVEQAVLGGGPVLGITGLLVASMVHQKPVAHTSHDNHKHLPMVPNVPWVEPVPSLLSMRWLLSAFKSWAPGPWPCYRADGTMAKALLGPCRGPFDCPCPSVLWCPPHRGCPGTLLVTAGGSGAGMGARACTSFHSGRVCSGLRWSQVTCSPGKQS